MSQFRPVGTRQASLLWRERPRDHPNYVRFGPSADGVEAYIHRDVLQMITKQLHLGKPNETIGLLGGRACEDQQGYFTIVCAIVSARGEEFEHATAGHVQLSAEGHVALRQRMAQARPELEVVGWYHTHPAYVAQFSGMDRTEQATWPEPYNIGLIASGLPHGEPFGVYAGPSATPLRRATPLPQADGAVKLATRTRMLVPSNGKLRRLPVRALPRHITRWRVWITLPWLLMCGMLLWTVSRVNDLETQVAAAAQAVQPTSSIPEPMVSQPAAPTPIAATPTINAQCTPTSGVAPLNVVCDATSDAQVMEWLWNFGDGHTGAGASVTHRYAATGSYQLRLTALMPEGNQVLVLPKSVQVQNTNLHHRPCRSVVETWCRNDPQFVPLRIG